jgi:predicted RNA-binding Zn-ribbon protein involved in translation (DUF1610 family)
MGASKRVAEEVVLAQASGSGPSFSIVRFGNVLGSNGSVVPLFLEQIARGGPVTVTDPEVRRFFMMIPEAVSLVLHAAARAHNGGTYVLDMGEQIKILDLAKNLIRQTGLVPEKDIRIVFTGLRPGEKMAEELVSESEALTPSGITNVSSVVRSPAVVDLARRVQALEELALTGNASQVVVELRSLASAAYQEVDAVAGADDPATADDQEPRMPCPNCAEGSIIRSRARTRAERVRKRVTSRRLYKCDTCGWRGWHQQVDLAGPSQLQRPAPPDLSALDKGTSELSHATAPTHLAPTRRRRFSPRDL